jgi:uncharacterized protein YyaL (SSP411 family)
MPNRLADATSPYLLQHASNPVDWWSWGPEAFAEARRRDVPVLISVGYSACHWCHVMAHESFEDADVAALVNEHFVAIKVDREERPDVDAVYMRATQALTGQGGWPMTVFATPEGQPFFAGTYFPPEPTDGQPSFTQVVDALGRGVARPPRRGAGFGVRDRRSAHRHQRPPAGARRPRRVAADRRVWRRLRPAARRVRPHPSSPRRCSSTRCSSRARPGTLDLAQRTLEAMARGGIHDQVGGGFHRYAVDAGWVVPHFEKMLYDNALLLGAYARGWRRTPQHDAATALAVRAGRPLHRGVARARDGVEGGGFGASLDADSADIRGMAHEGIYYVWNPELLGDALSSEDAAWAAHTFHVTTAGTFEHGLSTLQLRGAPETDRLAAVSARLLEVRGNRFAPPRDDKVIASWNGWAIDSLLSAAMIFGERAWVDLARDAAEYLWATHRTPAGLVRSSLNGVAGDAPGTAEDYGAAALAFARLAGVLGEASWLERAEALLADALVRFDAPGGGFYDGAADDLYTRPRDVQDNPTPSGTMSARRRPAAGGPAGRPSRADRPRRRRRRDHLGHRGGGTPVRARRPGRPAGRRRGTSRACARRSPSCWIRTPTRSTNPRAPSGGWHPRAPRCFPGCRGRPGSGAPSTGWGSRPTRIPNRRRPGCSPTPASGRRARSARLRSTTSTRSSRSPRPCTSPATATGSPPPDPSRTPAAPCGAAPEPGPGHPSGGCRSFAVN